MNTTPTIPGAFVVQSQGPDQPVFILGPDPQNRFIARMEQGTMEDAFLLEASRDLLSALEALLAYDMNDAPEPHPATYEFEIYTAARAAINKATGKNK